MNRGKICNNQFLDVGITEWGIGMPGQMKAAVPPEPSWLHIRVTVV